MGILALMGMLMVSIGEAQGLGTASADDPSNALTLFSIKLSSLGTDDGWILESREGSGRGGSLNLTDPVIGLGDDAQDRQYRAVLSFDTSALPLKAVIQSVALKVKKQGISGTDPFTTHGNLTVDLRKGMFSNNRTLQLGDFAVAPSRTAVMNFSRVPVSGWYTANLGAANFGYINRTGLTQFRLRFTRADNDDRDADILKIYSGNAGAAGRPTLVILYQMDTTAPAMIDSLLAARGNSPGEVGLSWIAVGDDGNTGTAAGYEVRYSINPIVDETAWNAAQPVSGVIPSPQAAGSPETMTVTGLTPGAQFFFAVRAVDEALNQGGLAANSPGAVAHIVCGQVITEDTLLATDLSCPPETAMAIMVNASNITLDLGGHTISSTYSGTLEQHSGVFMTGRTGVTIRNGVIDGFHTGVYVDSSNLITLESLSIRNMDFSDPLKFVFGAVVVQSQQVVVRNSLFEFPMVAHKEAVEIYGSTVEVDNIEVSGGGAGVNFSFAGVCDPVNNPNNGIVRNSRFSNIVIAGVLAACSNGALIEHNSFSLGSGNAIVGSGPFPQAVTGLKVEGNIINGDHYTGIQFGGVTESTISNNSITGSYYGIAMVPSLGCVDPATGWECFYTSNNAITDNTAVGNAIDLYHDENSVENVWDRNTCITKEGVEIPPCVPPDSTAPATIDDLSATRGTTAGTVGLSWTAPGDDGNTGTATGYEIRYAAGPIMDEIAWNAATPVSGIIPTPQAAGTPETMTVTGLAPGAQFFFAVRAVDEASNRGGVSSTSPGAVAHIVCGQIITENTLLATDLSCPPGNVQALVIGAPNILLDLGGHTISGHAPGIGVFAIGQEGVTIKNGAIEGFNAGVFIIESHRAILEYLTVRNLESDDPGNAIFGLQIQGSQDVIVRDSSFEFLVVAHKEAVEIYESYVDVSNIEVRGGGAGVNFSFAGACDPVNRPSNGTVRNSKFSNIAIAGIEVACSSYAWIEGNVFSAEPAVGIGIQGDAWAPGDVTGLTIKNNFILDTLIGIEFRGILDSNISNNQVSNNQIWGVAIRQSLGCITPQPGWECFYSTGNGIADNQTWGNGLDLYHYELALGNTWQQNTCTTKDGSEIPPCLPLKRQFRPFSTRLWQWAAQPADGDSLQNHREATRKY